MKAFRGQGNRAFLAIQELGASDGTISFFDGLAEAFDLLAARKADYLDELAENDANVEAVCRRFVPF